MIRNMQEADLPGMADIWLQTNLQAHAFLPASYWRENFEMVRQALLEAEVYVYVEGQQLLGFVGLNGEYIEGIFVRLEAQSQGVGKKLLDFVKGKKAQLSLCVYQKNPRAVRFYQREQFQIQCENIDQDTGEMEYRMVYKAITP